MKSLYIIRHAKSSHANPGQMDFDRPLNDRGHADAQRMATRLKEKIQSLDLLLASPANRAKTTCQYFADAFGIRQEKILFIPELYHAHPSTFLQTILQIDDHVTKAALFSHNPGITYFVNSLTDERLDNMPTCGVFGVQAAITSWKDFDTATKQFVYFDYPKNH